VCAEIEQQFPRVADVACDFAAAASGPLDHIYSRIGLVNGGFFPEVCACLCVFGGRLSCSPMYPPHTLSAPCAQGWGDLGIVNLEEDIKIMQAWPPPGLKV
jgi:hypothetical protein